MSRGSTHGEANDKCRKLALKHHYRLHSLIEIADKQQQDLEKEAKRSHLALEKAQKTTEKRERAYKAKVEALETQVTFSEMIL